MKSDLEIAREAKIVPIKEVAAKAGVLEDELELYGNYKAKVSLDILERLKDRPDGKLIDVTAITPTPLGEGKTVATVGLGQAFGKLGVSSVTCIRQPSLGPVFGIKGGAAGGGYSQVIPMEDFNLHLTGDFHAVSAAHNLCSAFLDNHIFKGNELGIDPDSVTWRRSVDVSDRSLREAEVGLGGEKNGIPHHTGWDITSASELMAILALAEDLPDLRRRIGGIVVASTYDGKPVTAEDIHVAGSMTVLLKDAIRPTLLQNLENEAVLVHAGPFANIAHGNSSIIADRIALKMGDYVITESGFGADLGCEKFVDIKCRYSGMKPDCIVIVATVRALKAHSGKYKVVAGEDLPEGLVNEDLEALSEGICNLTRHVENCRKFGVPVVVVANAFPTDTDAEHQMICEAALAAGASEAVVHHLHAQGAEGGIDLAEAVMRACDEPAEFKMLYPDDMSVTDKIERIATEIYRADGVDFSEQARASIQKFTDWGYGDLPVCIAKTQYSISDDPSLLGAPDGWRLKVSDVRLSAGAGFLYALCGNMMTMPGLPKVPAGNAIDIDEDGNIVGLF
ncbi:MAG: formate--tetrahydrofolate ligase [Coriobacteriaceae bacterium]|nr:formate--tetrahydrofolate ligase [Coriobacteriaceae bacterium]